MRKTQTTDDLAEYLELLADIADAGRPKLKDDKRRIAAAELRRLSAELAALKAAIGEPVAVVSTKKGSRAHQISFGPYGGVYDLKDGSHDLYAIPKDKP